MFGDNASHRRPGSTPAARHAWVSSLVGLAWLRRPDRRHLPHRPQPLQSVAAGRAWSASWPPAWCWSSCRGISTSRSARRSASSASSARCCRPTVLQRRGAGDTWWIASLAMLAAGSADRDAAGCAHRLWRHPSFVVTLGGLLFFRNAAYQINRRRDRGAARSDLPAARRRARTARSARSGAGSSASLAIAAIALRGASRGRRRRRGFGVRCALR